MSEEDYQRGMKVRRRVMGDEFVDRAMDAVTDFTQPVQDYINENCWGSVWARETLPLKTRSIITIATLAENSNPLSPATLLAASGTTSSTARSSSSTGPTGSVLVSFVSARAGVAERAIPAEIVAAIRPRMDVSMTVSLTV